MTLTLLLIIALVGSAWWLVQRARPRRRLARRPPARGRGRRRRQLCHRCGARTRGELPIVIDALGTVTPPVTATLVPQVAGVLTEVLFTEGADGQQGPGAGAHRRSTVRAGAGAGARPARQDEAQLAAAKVTLALPDAVAAGLDRARQDVDTQAALVKQLEGVVEADRASERAAQLNVGFASIRAPIGGRIDLRAIDPGNLVSAGSAGGIATITRSRRSTWCSRCRRTASPPCWRRSGAAGCRCWRWTAAAASPGRGQLSDAGQSRSAPPVRCAPRPAFANADGELFPNQFVNARLQLGHDSGVLVPVTALRTGPRAITCT